MDFEAGMKKEVERLRGKALAAQERFHCFMYQVAQFEAEAKAEVRPEGGAATGPREEPARVAAAGETEAEPAATATAGGGSPPAPIPPNLFARLSGDRYRIVYGQKDETVPMLAGLQLVEYLLRQPGKAAHVLDINRALSEGNPRAVAIEDAFARSEEEKRPDGFSPDGSWVPDPYSQEDLEQAEQAAEGLDARAAEARKQGRWTEAERLEDDAERTRKVVQEQRSLAARKRRGQPDQDSPTEKVRLKLTKNFKNACESLRMKYGLSELADHLEEQIESGAKWKYRPAPGVEWAFSLSAR
jgi:hypothetical protein